MTKRANRFLWNIHTAIKKTRVPGSDEDKRFLALALFGECGEVANLIKKKWRGDDIPDFDAKLREELGDTYAYLILFAMAYRINLTDIEQFVDFTVPDKGEELHYLASLLASKCGKLVDAVLLHWVAEVETVLDASTWLTAIETQKALRQLATHCGIDLDQVLNDEIIPKVQARYGHLVEGK